MGDGVRVETPPLPTGTVPMPHQVGGHTFGQGKTKIGMLVREDGVLLKPCQDKSRGERELLFYQSVFDPASKESLLSLRPLLPSYHGTWTTPQHPGVVYFCLEDITKRFKLPCVLDIKVGPITYDPQAGPEKIASETKKYPSKEISGFSVVGIKVVDPVSLEVYSRTSKELRYYSCDEVLTKVLNVFFNKQSKLCPALVQAFINRLRPIKDWFHSQTQLHFFASSILFVYDAMLFQSCPDECEPTSLDKGDAECNGNLHSCVSQMDGDEFNRYIDLRMIDFTHVFSADSHDDNYIRGLQGVEDYFMKVLQ